MNLLIVQARMGSTRLPGKVLKTIDGISLLELQYQRIKKAKLVDKILIATTDKTEDQKIINFCNKLGIDCFAGSESDVLDRYYQAAKKYKPKNIIRITSDCPLHHHEVVDFVIEAYLEAGFDYFSNSNFEPDFLEDGFDVEVFSMEALKTTWKKSNLKSEREHVTAFIKKDPRFTCGWKKYNKLYNFKLSVDSKNDFKLVEKIFSAFNDKYSFTMADVIKLLKDRPELLQINKESIINSGFKKSIENDKKI